MVTFWCAVVVVIWLALRQAKFEKIDKKLMWLLFIWTFCSGILFSRLFITLFWYKGTFINSILFFFNFSRSGLSSYGAVFGIILGAYIFNLRQRCKNIKISIWKMLDVASIGMMLGLAIGRIGCFLAGCCYGKEIVMNIPWAIMYKGALRHPTQVYDMLNGLFVFFVVWKLKNRKHFEGQLFLTNIILYSFFRIIVEIFRVGPKIGMISYNQIFYGLLLVVGGFIYYRKSKHQ